jgi:hypothetical protein
VDARTGGDLFQERLVKFGGICHHLQVGDDGAVVEGDELHEVVTAAGANPTFHVHGVAYADDLGGFDDIFQS